MRKIASVSTAENKRLMQQIFRELANRGVPSAFWDGTTLKVGVVGEGVHHM